MNDENLNQELRVDPEDLLKKPVRQREKRRGSRRFTRFLVAICIGVVGTLAWQSYGEAIKQTIAIRAPELGWSPESKQMIASSIQWLGWMKPPAGPEKTDAETVASKAPIAPSLDAAQVQQMVQNLAAVRETVQELAAGQNQMAREIDKLESAVVEILMKMPERSPQPPAAPAQARASGAIIATNTTAAVTGIAAHIGRTHHSPSSWGCRERASPTKCVASPAGARPVSANRLSTYLPPIPVAAPIPGTPAPVSAPTVLGE
jgi:hypothetical protein